MSPNEELLKTFYTCFQQREPNGMTACYHPEVLFSDPIFQMLKGKQAISMWHMLIERSKDMEIVFGNIQADEQSGTAHWEAKYTYSATGRKVHNVVNAQFRFQEGSILVHHDIFDLWHWASQALGMSGYLLGWTPFMQHTIRSKTAQLLNDYIDR